MPITVSRIFPAVAIAALLLTWSPIEAQRPATPSTARHSEHWAYRSPVRPSPPAVRNVDWVRTPIDRFVLAPLEADGLAPSVEAPLDILTRRVFLDLVGLPP